MYVFCDDACLRLMQVERGFRTTLEECLYGSGQTAFSIEPHNTIQYNKFKIKYTYSFAYI